MAVNHATRQRSGLLAPRGFLAPRIVPEPSGRSSGARATAAATATTDAVALPRRRARVTVRAGRRSESRVGLALGGIIVAFVLAFFSLAQTVRVSATGYDIDRLLVERNRLEAQRQELLSDLNRLGRGPAIRKGAIDAGLGQLAEPLVVPAR